MSKPWNSSEVTWNNATKTEKWEQLDRDARYYSDEVGDTVEFPGGGDRIFPCAATAPVANIVRRWETYTITQELQKYIKNPSTFYGLYLKPYMENTGRYYASSECLEQDKRPKLTIKYSGTGIISDAQSKNALYNNLFIDISSKKVHIFIPFQGDYLVSIVDLKGRTLYSFNGYNSQWYSIPKSVLSSGLNILRVSNSDRYILKNFVFIK